MKILISLLIIMLLTSCVQQTVNETAITGEVNEVFEAYANHVNTKGLQGVESYFSDDNRFYWVEDGVTQYPSHDALKQGILEFSPSVKSVRLMVNKTDITPLSNDMASLYVEYVEDLEMKSGYKFSLDGVMTILMLKENNTWKFFQGHSSIKKPRGN